MANRERRADGPEAERAQLTAEGMTGTLEEVLSGG